MVTIVRSATSCSAQPLGTCSRSDASNASTERATHLAANDLMPPATDVSNESKSSVEVR